MLVTSSSDLAAICGRLAQHPFVTVDTEFLRETTFWPKLCVIQMASPDEAVAVDALAPGMDLAPFFDLMTNPAVVKVFHAARQDIEIVWHLSQRIPTYIQESVGDCEAVSDTCRLRHRLRLNRRACRGRAEAGRWTGRRRKAAGRRRFRG